MFAFPTTRASRPLAVLLGGSGHARPAPRPSALPALLRPRPAAPGRCGRTSVPGAASA